MEIFVIVPFFCLVFFFLAVPLFAFAYEWWVDALTREGQSNQREKP